LCLPISAIVLNGERIAGFNLGKTVELPARPVLVVEILFARLNHIGLRVTKDSNPGYVTLRHDCATFDLKAAFYEGRPSVRWPAKSQAASLRASILLLAQAEELNPGVE
jgi:hypothetical protein